MSAEQPVELLGDALTAGMVKISKMIADLQSIMDRFGDTCVYIKPGVSWGATALWAQSDTEKAIEETAASFAATFKPEFKELAQQIMSHAISEGWTHQFAKPKRESSQRPFNERDLINKALDLYGMIDTEQMYRTVKAMRALSMSSHTEIEGEES